MMKIYVKSAGFSVNQDYCWMDEEGRRAEPGASVIQADIEHADFVWKKTGKEILIFANHFVDSSRTDLSNRPIRNDILFRGKLREARQMFVCFANLILRSEEFGKLLRNCIQTGEEKSDPGFTVDFGAIRSFVTEEMPDFEAHRMKRYLCGRDSYEARGNFLCELKSTLKKNRPVLALVGGNVSLQLLQEKLPDRALLAGVNEDFRYNRSEEDSEKLVKTALAGATLVGAGVLISGLVRLYSRGSDGEL